MINHRRLIFIRKRLPLLTRYADAKRLQACVLQWNVSQHHSSRGAMNFQLRRNYPVVDLCVA